MWRHRYSTSRPHSILHFPSTGKYDLETRPGSPVVGRCSGKYDLETRPGSPVVGRCSGKYDLETRPGSPVVGRCSGKTKEGCKRKRKPVPIDIVCEGIFYSL